MPALMFLPPFWALGFLGVDASVLFAQNLGTFLAHQTPFAWPQGPLFFVSFLVILLCMVVVIRAHRQGLFFIFSSGPLYAGLLVFLALTAALSGGGSSPWEGELGAPASPLPLFSWGSAPHGGSLLFWRDFVFLGALLGAAPLKPLQDLLAPAFTGGAWAAALGGVWALAGTTPPLLWASDKIELCTLLGALLLIFWTHRWPQTLMALRAWWGFFSALVLALQVLGAWTFHHSVTHICQPPLNPEGLSQIAPSLPSLGSGGPALFFWFLAPLPRLLWGRPAAPTSHHLPCTSAQSGPDLLEVGPHIWAAVLFLGVGLALFGTLWGVMGLSCAWAQALMFQWSGRALRGL